MDQVKAFFKAMSAPLEWTASRIAARPKGALLLGCVAVVAAFITGARWF